MAERLDDDDKISSLVGGNYMKTEDFDPRGKVFTIAGFRTDEIKNSDDPAKECAVMFFEDEEKGFILKKTTIGELVDALEVDSKKAAVGKRIEIYRGKTQYQGKSVPCMRLRAPSNERQAGE